MGTMVGRDLWIIFVYGYSPLDLAEGLREMLYNGEMNRKGGFSGGAIFALPSC